MTTNKIAQQAAYKVWYYLENPENEQHSGKKIIDLINRTFDLKEVDEFNSILKEKNINNIATLINLIENKLIEDSNFQKDIERLTKLPDKAIQLPTSIIENNSTNYEFVELLLTILMTSAFLLRYFVEGSFNKFNLLVIACALLLMRLLKKQGTIRNMLNVSILLYSALFIINTMVQGQELLAFWYLTLDICLILILIFDYKKNKIHR